MKITREDIKDVIVGLIAKGGFASEKLSKDTTINKDLFIQGDDAIDFFNELHEVFAIQFGQLDYAKYFIGEGQFFSLKMLPPFTIQMLEDIIFEEVHRENQFKNYC